MKEKDGKSQSDELAKRLFMDLESQSENEQSTAKKTLKTPKTLPRRRSATRKVEKGSGYLKSPSTKKIKDYITAKRKSAPKKCLEQMTADETGVGSDDEVTFNFRARGASTSDVFVERPEQNERKSTSEKVTTSAMGRTQTKSPSRKVAVVRKPDDSKMEVETSVNVGVEQSVESHVADLNQAKEEVKKGNNQMKRKRRKKKKNEKETKQTTEIPVSKNLMSAGPKKRAKSSDDIFFYCGNLPPGVTSEVLCFFLNEEGITCRVKLQTVKHKMEPLKKLTAKQMKYNKNQKKAAQAVFATVIVETEEDAKKMQSLNGVAMPSTTRLDWDTNLKIVRRLPRPNKYPFKVHVSGLHPAVTEEELKSYLQSRAVEPGLVVIIRRPKNQRSKGFGFVWFESVPKADKAVDLPDPVLREQKLVIEHSFKKKFKNF